MKRNKITKVFRNLALGLVITASGLILEIPAHAEINLGSGRYWYYDQGKYTDEQHAYTYRGASGDMITTDNLDIARYAAVGEIQTKNGVLQNTQEDRNKAIEQEKINKQLEMQKPENQPISYEEFRRIANEEMLRLVNEHREANGVQPLEWDDTLAKMATEKSEHMVTHNYFGHYYKGIFTGPVQEIEWGVFSNGENILANYKYDVTKNGAKAMAISMFNQWKASPGHNETMLRDSCTKIGFGFAFNNGNAKYDSYGTQIFGADNMYDYKDGDIWLDCGATKLSDLDNL